MPIQLSISIPNAFKTVGEQIDQASHPRSIEMRYLSDYYDISAASVVILAYILRYHPNKVIDGKLRILAQNNNEQFDEVVKKLVRRKFIEPKETSCNSGMCFGITNSAYKAINEGAKFGMDYFEDCITELSSCHIENIYSDKWLQRFYYSMRMEENRRLKEACDRLEINTLPLKYQRAFWSLARFFSRHFTDPFNMDGDSIPAGADIENDLGAIAKLGLATVIPIEEDSITRSQFILSANAAELLFSGRPEIVRYDELAKFATIIKAKDIQKKELFFSEQAQDEINHLRTMLTKEGYERARGILIRKKRAPSIQSLLWGPPGTGKTETVKQLALESGRDIVLFDLSKVTGYGWGTTEKSYRSLFRAYNYVALIGGTVPILLLNEADAILTKRLHSMERAIDKSENIVTNILLEEMENLNGIMLATTNLIDNLDEAFDRRFLFKTELEKPDQAARAKIWKSSIPELSEAEAAYLANTYEMSGAQINNVVTKRDLAELYFTGDRGILYIETLCKKEISTEKSVRMKQHRIGF